MNNRDFLKSLLSGNADQKYCIIYELDDDHNVVITDVRPLIFNECFNEHVFVHTIIPYTDKERDMKDKITANAAIARKQVLQAAEKWRETHFVDDKNFPVEYWLKLNENEGL